MRRAALALACAACSSELATTEQPATVCAAGPTVKGMDVAVYDDVTDWAAAKAGGIDFVFVRVSDGLNFPDSKFATYWPAAQNAGILRGAYQYFEPAQDPIAQADMLLTKAGPPQPGDLPPVLDLEVSGGLSQSQVVAAVQQWVDHVTAAIGRPPIVYAGLYSWPTLTGGADFTTSPLWIAQYTSAACPDIPAPWTQWLFWQTTGTGTAPGVSSSAVDLDTFNGTIDDLTAFANGPSAPCGTIGFSGGEIDDGDPCFVAGGPASSLRYVAAGEGGDLIWTHTTNAATEANFAQWDLVFEAGGTYQVEAYTDHAYATSKQAGYHVRAAGQTVVATLDQSAADGWQSLGTFTFAAGGGQSIHLGDNTGEPSSENAQIVFDAIRLTRVDSPNFQGQAVEPHASGGCAAGGSPGWLLVLLVFPRRRRSMCARS